MTRLAFATLVALIFVIIWLIGKHCPLGQSGQLSLTGDRCVEGAGPMQ
jgi:hypothetical protein